METLLKGRHLALLIGATVIAGCGGATETMTPVAVGSSGGRHATPVSQFIGWDWQDPSPEDATLWNRHVEEAVSACMHAEGFRYEVAESGVVEDVGNVALAARDRMPADEYARRYGYGISTSFQGKIPIVEEFDPNAQYIDNLGDSEREAYFAALQGASFGEARSGRPGCTERAYVDVMGGRDVTTTIDKKYQQLVEDIRSDPRTTEANGRWSDCMIDRGYDLLVPDEAQERAVEAFDALMTEARTRMEDAGTIIRPGETVRPPVDRRKLADARRDERALATADQRCVVEALIDETRFDVRWDLERAFLNDNRALLEKQRDAWRALNG